MIEQVTDRRASSDETNDWTGDAVQRSSEAEDPEVEDAVGVIVRGRPQ